MKKIGIIGGAGPLASALLYESIVKECYRVGKAVPEIVIFNYPFTRALTLKEGEEHREILLEELQKTVAALRGVDLGLLACNTLHRYLKEIKPDFPFLHLPEAVLQEAISNGHRRLLILASQNTCAHGLYRHPQATSLYPHPDEQEFVDQMLDRLTVGKVTREDSSLLSHYLASQTECEGVVLGCTDLPVLHDQYPLETRLPLYDSIKIPAKHVVGIL